MEDVVWFNVSRFWKNLSICLQEGDGVVTVSFREYLYKLIGVEEDSHHLFTYIAFSVGCLCSSQINHRLHSLHVKLTCHMAF